jgi:hypothetical protein
MKEFLTHTDFKNGYRIKYPAHWQKQALSPTMTGFFAPRESPADIFSENVNVGVEEASVTLDEQVDFQVTQMQAGNLQLIGRSEKRLADLPAQALEFRGQLGPVMKHGRIEMVAMQWLQVYVLKDKRVYCLTYTAEPLAYDKYMPQVQEMLASLELS